MPKRQVWPVEYLGCVMEIHERFRILGWIPNCVNDFCQPCRAIPNIQIGISASYRIRAEQGNLMGVPYGHQSGLYLIAGYIRQGLTGSNCGCTSEVYMLSQEITKPNIAAELIGDLPCPLF
jgi:hypothetical protein